MGSPLFWIALAITLDGLAGLAGALVPRRWLDSRGDTIIAFAAGAMIAAALADILPEALLGGRGAALATALGFASFLALDSALGGHAHGHGERPGVTRPAL